MLENVDSWLYIVIAIVIGVPLCIWQFRSSRREGFRRRMKERGYSDEWIDAEIKKLGW